MIDDVTERGGAFARTAVNLFWKPTDGSGSAEPLTTSDYAQQPSSWSPDGKLLVFDLSLHPETGRD